MPPEAALPSPSSPSVIPTTPELNENGVHFVPTPSFTPTITSPPPSTLISIRPSQTATPSALPSWPPGHALSLDDVPTRLRFDEYAQDLTIFEMELIICFGAFVTGVLAIWVCSWCECWLSGKCFWHGLKRDFLGLPHEDEEGEEEEGKEGGGEGKGEETSANEGGGVQTQQLEVRKMPVGPNGAKAKVPVGLKVSQKSLSAGSSQSGPRDLRTELLRSTVSGLPPRALTGQHDPGWIPVRPLPIATVGLSGGTHGGQFNVIRIPAVRVDAVGVPGGNVVYTNNGARVNNFLGKGAGK